MKNHEAHLQQAALRKRFAALISAQGEAAPPAGGWLRHFRLAFSLSQADVARQMGVSKQAYAQFEQGETQGTISLHSLRRAAAAMDCDLAYFLVPRSGGTSASMAGHARPDLAAASRSDESSTIRKPPAGRNQPEPDITLNLEQTHTLL